MPEWPALISFQTAVGVAAALAEACGVATILLGVAMAFPSAVPSALQGSGDGEKRQRRRLGRALLIGLEFLVAADVIRSVAIAPTLDSVGVLAPVVMVRTFLNWTLELELEGRWPWQRDSATGERLPPTLKSR